jgi:cell division protein FtsW
MAIAKRGHRPDYTFFLLIAALCLFGLLMILSAGAVQSFKLKGNGYFYFLQQLESLGLGLIGFYITSRIHYSYWKKIAVPLLAISFFLLLVIFVPGIGFNYGGATRWINFPLFHIQVAEIAKLGLVIYLAAWLSTKAGPNKGFTDGFAPFAAIVGAMATLVMLQPDMGTMSVIAMIGIVMYFTAGAPVRHIALAAGGVVAAVAALIAAAPYRINRLLTFLDPTKDTLGTGYHVQQALVAIGSGGLFGLGFNKSLQKHNYLPEPMNDSIFAIITEELGLIAAAAVIATFAYLAVRGFRIASRAPDMFSRLLVTGIVTWICWQALVNISAMLSLVPLTGVPLPFISLGGSALVVLMTACGIVFNVSRFTAPEREAAGKEAGRAHTRSRRGNRRSRRSAARGFSRA